MVRNSSRLVCSLLLASTLLGGLSCSSSESPVGKSDDGAGQGDSSEVGDEPSPETDAQDSAASAWVGDGTLDTVELSLVYDAPDQFFCSPTGCRVGLAVDLEFNPARPGELWVLYRQPYDGAPCEESNRTAACELLGSKVAIISDADTDSPDVEIEEDGNSWHFMRVATALAFADDDTFATVGEARTGNWMDNDVDFMGPTWWSADPNVFAVDFGLNGSHLDMLHATPFGMGIAHDPTSWAVGDGFETGPVFWAYNGDVGAIDRYDFKQPHQPGGEDHSDGTLHRYVTGQLKMAPGIPSHMEFASLGRVPERESLFGPSASDDEGTMPDWWLYIADTGNQRIVRLDTKSGRLGEPIVTPDPQLEDPRTVEDAVLEEVVPKGRLEAPTGLAVAGELLFVSDAATSLIHVFDLQGETLAVLDTELPAWSLAGLAIGPDDKLYFVNWSEGSVHRVEPN